MNGLRRVLRPIAMGMVCLLVVPDAGFSQIAQWDFDGNLASSNGGADLAVGFALPAVVDDVEFTTSSIGGENAQVARFSRGTYFIGEHDLDPNDGGGFLNQFSLIMDVMFPERPVGWAGGLYQTDELNADDGEWYVNPDGGIGISGQYVGNVQDNQWYRLTLVIDSVADVYRCFIDGELVNVVDADGNGQLDGRFAIKTTVLFFADENEENAPGFVNSIQLRDYAMSDDEVRALGGPSAAGIPVTDPFACPAITSCRVDQLSRSVDIEWSELEGLEGAGFTGYSLSRDGTELGVLPLATTTFSDTDVPAGPHQYELTLVGGDLALCSGLPSSCRVEISGGEIFLADDFEGYVDEFDLTDFGGWQIVEVGRLEPDPIDPEIMIEVPPNEVNTIWRLNTSDPCRSTNPPTSDGTPSEGKFIISDSDCFDGAADGAGSMFSHDIWSPIFDTTDGSGEVWLHMDCSAVLNNNGTCVFDIDVSTDEGESWNNVFRRVAPERPAIEPEVTLDNADGVYQRLSVDLTEFAANEPGVMFRLRHFEPDWDWWIAVDNVVVNDQPPPSGEVVLLAPESFGAGIPATWTLRSELGNSGTETWHTTDKGGRFTGRVGGQSVNRVGPTFAIVDSDADPDPAEDEYLITPSIDCTEAEEVVLHYRSEMLLNGGETAADVLVSLDGGETFLPSPLFSYTQGALIDPGEDPMYGEFAFSVPEAAGQSDVAFAFHYQSAGNQWWWAITDVRVTATGENLSVLSCPNRAFSAAFNPATVSTELTWNALEGDGSYRVLANGADISGVLAAATASFTDASPPPGGTVVYTLNSYTSNDGSGVPNLVCDTPPVSVVACPRDLACCQDLTTGNVVLQWSTGVNLAGAGFRVTRNGVPRTTVTFDTETWTDESIPGPGDYTYVLSILGDVPQCSDLECTVTVTGESLTGSIFFFDDFECYATDADVVAGGWEIRDENDPIEFSTWTITDPLGRGVPPPLEDGTPGRGNFMISDSDFGGGNGANPPGSGMSHDMWSPVFSTTGASTVWLHMNVSAVLNNNGECIFDIDVSTDGGNEWTNVFRRIAPGRTAEPFPLADIPEGFELGPQVGNADGYYGRLHLDISDVAANEAEVRFRVRHFEPNFDWWIAIDDVLVDDSPVAGGNTTLLDLETFIDGIPDDWIVESNAGAVAPWSTVDHENCRVSTLNFSGGLMPDGADGRRLHHFDTEFALVAFDADGLCGAAAKDETLATPVLDCSDMDNVYLHVKSSIGLMGSATAEILVSLDGGTTFSPTPVFSYHGGGLALRDNGNDEVYYGEHVFAVPEAAGQSEVVFAFHYVSAADLFAGFWALDDIQVTGDGDLGGIPFHRGEVNGDGGLNIADPIFLLNHLFAGGPGPTCRDTADTNGDNAINIADPIYLLNFSFGGGPPPPPPGPPADPCGLDPEGDDDGITCESYEGCL